MSQKDKVKDGFFKKPINSLFNDKINPLVKPIPRVLQPPEAPPVNNKKLVTRSLKKITDQRLEPRKPKIK